MIATSSADVLVRLIDELAVVTEHFSIEGRGDTVRVTAWVTPDHAGAVLLPGATNGYFESLWAPIADAIEQVLEVIALAAPQEVSA